MKGRCCARERRESFKTGARNPRSSERSERSQLSPPIGHNDNDSDMANGPYES